MEEGEWGGVLYVVRFRCRRCHDRHGVGTLLGQMIDLASGAPTVQDLSGSPSPFGANWKFMHMSRRRLPDGARATRGQVRDGRGFTEGRGVQMNCRGCGAAPRQSLEALARTAEDARTRHAHDTLL